MSKYILAESINWADEADVNFLEILDEEEYKKYQYLCDKVKLLPGSYYFGTNEGFEENEFDYLGFTYEEISDDESKIIEKYIGRLSCGTIYDDIFRKLIDSFDFKKISDISKIEEKGKYISSYKLKELPYDEFIKIIDEAIKYPKDEYLDACDEYKEYN